MNKKYLFITIIIVFLVLGGWWTFLGKKANKPTTPLTTTIPTTLPPFADPAYVATAAPKLKQIQVNYTDTGFVPAKVTIKKGTAVVFVNKSKKPMFMESKSLEFLQTVAGDVYAYTFTREGTWSYQNHAQTSDTGTVIVTP